MVGLAKNVYKKVYCILWTLSVLLPTEVKIQTVQTVPPMFWRNLAICHCT